ncbi:MAG: response regulator transcription factor [Anaerolineales bacterium]
MPIQKVRVAILDDHQSIIDGFTYRINSTAGVEVVASALFGKELNAMLRRNSVDVLLIDLSVRTSAEDSNAYPVLRTIPQLLQKYPDLKVVVVSMYGGPGLIRMIMEAGVSGYITKDDYEALRDLGKIVLSIADGHIYFTDKALNLYKQGENGKSGGDTLSPRQIEALSLCALHPDLGTADLAQMLAVSNSTVRNLLSSAYVKLGVHSRTAAVEMARNLGLITPNASDGEE